MKDHNTVYALFLRKKFRLPAKPENYTYDDAIRLTRAALKVAPKNASLYFNLACFYSACQETQRSLFYLEAAFRKGYDDWQKVQSDISLANARSVLEFHELVKAYR